MSRNKVPIVAIVGRANVGKSSLFNAIIGHRQAIVAEEAGTTRDSIMGKASVMIREAVKSKSTGFSELSGMKGKDAQPGFVQKDFWLVDTAGIKDAEDEFEFTIQEQILQAADSADIICVVVEADIPVTDEDRRVAKLALKSKKPVILVVNKTDKNHAVNLDEYLKLGVKPVLGTSTTQRTGIEQLKPALPKQTTGFVLPFWAGLTLVRASYSIHLAKNSRPLLQIEPAPPATLTAQWLSTWTVK
jgi:GTPase